MPLEEIMRNYVADFQFSWNREIKIPTDAEIRENLLKEVASNYNNTLILQEYNGNLVYLRPQKYKIASLPKGTKESYRIAFYGDTITKRTDGYIYM